MNPRFSLCNHVTELPGRAVTDNPLVQIMKQEVFGSRLTMMLAMLGMAVGTGNIWRFPRIAAKNGGGEFLIAWVVFLFLWSIPLILLEFGFGRKTRRGPIQTFMTVMGPRWVWMGVFVVWVTTAITFYYSVVAGWTFRFALASGTGELSDTRLGEFWNDYISSAWPLVTHIFAIGTAIFVVARGVTWIERVTKVLMPILLVLILVLVVRAVTLPGANEGLSYLFSVDWANLSDPKLWVEALIQNAWDTGAGMGLVLCFAAYLREREDTALNGYILPAANNTVSLLAGIMVICTVFSVVPTLVDDLATDPQALDAYPQLAAAVQNGETLSASVVQETIFKQNNEGLTFIWMPRLFDALPYGQFFMLLFFLALSFAAFTSLIAMIELPVRSLVDAGIERSRAARIIGGTILVLGLPSVAWMSVLKNQDWVWGVGLMVSGLFFAIAAIRYGVQRLRKEQLNHEDSDVKIGAWWDIVIACLVPIEAIVLLVWLLYESSIDNADWWQPFSEYNVGTVLFQFAIVIGMLILLNRWIAGRHSGSA